MAENTYDMKMLPPFTGTVTDTSLIFGAIGGQSDSAPEPITALAFKNYIADGIEVTADSIGLGNVDNTSDADKPVSTLQAAADAAVLAAAIQRANHTGAQAIATVTGLQTALDAKEATANKNQANGYAGLDSGGKVAAAQLPSYVDDVLEYANFAALPVTGETGKIYVTTGDNAQYRWSGSAYVAITSSPGSTDAVPEGSTNLYHTSARVNALIAAAVGVSVQAYSATLAALSALSTTVFGRSLLVLANAAALRTAIALPTSTTAGRLARYSDSAGTEAPSTGIFEDASGNVAVGAGSVTSGVKLDVLGNTRITGVAAFGGSGIDTNVVMRSVMVLSNPAAARMGAQFSQFNGLTANNSFNVSGAEFLTQVQGSAVTASGINRGVFSQGASSLPAGGVASDVRGDMATVTNSGAGTITQAACVTARTFNSSTGVITAAHGLLIDNTFNPSGTITQQYGIRIQTLAAGTQTNLPYAIHSSDATARSYHAGNFGIGSAASTATARLDVDGGIRSRAVTVGTLPSASTEAAGTHRYVTDSNATMAAGLGNIVAGGGANFVRVYSDGTNWRIG